MPQEKLIDITVVLDRSGSMGDIADDTVKGFNYFVREQQKIEGTAVLTLVEFSTEFWIVYRAVRVQEVSPLDFHPAGGTALLDAVGQTIGDTAQRLSALGEAERPAQVLFAIITDGEENSSRTFSRQAVLDLIEEKQRNDGWQFVFLGANQDAFKEAGNLGIPCGSVMGFDASGAGVSRAFASLSESVADFRLGSASGDTFFYSCGDTVIDVARPRDPRDPEDDDDENVRRRHAYASALDFAAGQVVATIHRAADSFPAHTCGGRWLGAERPEIEGTAGFLVGLMWKFYACTGEGSWRRHAQHYARLLEPRKDDRAAQGLGLLFLNSHLPWHDLTGERGVREVLLAAGETLAQRFQERGQYLCSDAGPESLFIDDMMNVPLIFYAATESHRERLRELAYLHCRTTRQRLVRADGSTAQEGLFDPATGEFLRQGNRQCSRADGCWARGLAYSLYGFSRVFSLTGWEDALQTSQLNARYWLTHLPCDRVPPSDLDVAPETPSSGGAGKDSAAAAIVASGLLDLARQTPPTERTAAYRERAWEMLDVLIAPPYLARGVRGWEGILRHGLYDPANPLGVDESTMCGDYYLVEALMKALTDL